MITDTHQAKAAYRLLDRQDVTLEAVIEPHCAQTRARINTPGVVLLIEDTTAISFPSSRETTGLGPIGEKSTRGFWVHSTLAMRWEQCAVGQDRCWPVGLLHQHVWARPKERPVRRKSTGRGKESNQARQKRKDRESVRWCGGVVDLPPADAGCLRIYVADRESDMYEAFERCKAAGVSFIIRASHRRALVDPDGGMNLMEAAAKAELRGHVNVDLPHENRVAKLEVRSARVVLRGPPRPGGRLKDFALNIVQLCEVDAPKGVKPLKWVLLTDQPIDTLEDCERIARMYRCRWAIEEMHKGMKTGLGLERSQLSDYRRLAVLAGIVSIVAVSLLQMKWISRTDGERPLSREERKAPMVEVLHRQYPPRGEPTVKWLWTSIARLGGYMARKSDGPPGWLTIWRGWQTLMLMLRGYELADPVRCGER